MKRTSGKNLIKSSAALLLAASMLAGCGGGAAASGNSGTASGAADSNVPVALTVHDIYGTDVADFTAPVAVKLQEATNVTLTNTVSSSSTDEEQAWTLMISNPDSMPDIVVASDMSRIEKLGLDGGLIPLEDLIEEKCPNIVAAFEAYPVLRTASTASDGHIYQIAGMKEMSIANTWIIRQDWLDKLGLETPTTTDELYEVLKAFRTEDPNGNGVQDETPLMTRWLSAPDNFTEHGLSLFNSSNGLMVRQGKVVFDPMEEDFKVGMKSLIQWYSEGLIAPEVYTRDDARNALYGNNLAGLTFDWSASTTQYNVSLAETIPGFNNVVMAPVQAPNGRTVVDHRSVPFAGAGITQNCANVDAALRLLDYLYSEEGQVLMTYGIEGERYGAEEVHQWFFEVWNEPNLDAFWSGTRSQYFELYRVTSLRIKAIDPALKVGGPATSNYVPDGRFDGETEDVSSQMTFKVEDLDSLQWHGVWIEAFLQYCAEHKLPVDFVSCHPYPTDFALDGHGESSGRTRNRDSLAALYLHL